MADVSIDTSELRELIKDMKGVDGRLGRHAVPVVKRGAQNIKTAMQTDLNKSSNAGFRYIARTVNYDVDVADGAISAEIGPDKSVGGALANIAYFGSSKGGGTVRDPMEALRDEETNFMRELENLAEELIW